MIPNFIPWFQENTIPIILILLISAVVAQTGNRLLAVLIRRIVGRIRTDNSESDVKKRQDTLISMFGTLLTVLVWLTAGFTILGRMGIDLTPLLAGASVMGVALGFGAQSIIKDLLSGLFIIIENQYRVGDIVDIEGATGVVEQITVRSTIIRDTDGNVHYVPNGTIAHVINKTMGYSNVNFTVSVASDTNIDVLADTVNEVGETLAGEPKWEKKVLESPHFLSIGSFDETSLEALIIGRTQPSEQWDVANELRKRLVAAFKKADIKITKMPSIQGSPKKK
jgi:small conductance mechanosensitive channel